MCAWSQEFEVGRRVILRDDPYNDPDEGTLLEFRLTYEGILKGASRDDSRGPHKHDVRKVFHPQLRRLWQIVPYLDFPQKSVSQFQVHVNYKPEVPKSRSAQLADAYAYHGFRFVPLVTKGLALICGIEILFLRPDHPGSVLQSGDIDNRLKTLFDALRVPSPREVSDSKLAPEPSEHPFYCLLEEDKLITKVSVETDFLLQPTGKTHDDNDARLVITVKLRPAQLSWDNIAFG